MYKTRCVRLVMPDKRLSGRGPKSGYGEHVSVAERSVKRHFRPKHMLPFAKETVAEAERIRGPGQRDV